MKWNGYFKYNMNHFKTTLIKKENFIFFSFKKELISFESFEINIVKSRKSLLKEFLSLFIFCTMNLKWNDSKISDIFKSNKRKDKFQDRKIWINSVFRCSFFIISNTSKTCKISKIKINH